MVIMVENNQKREEILIELMPALLGLKSAIEDFRKELPEACKNIVDSVKEEKDRWAGSDAW